MLKPFRRHTIDCLKGLLTKKLSPEKLRVYTHCGCPCWFSGTWNGVTYKRQTFRPGVNGWSAAEKKCQEMMAESTKGLLHPEGNGIGLHDALERWYAEGERNELAATSMVQRRGVGRELEEFASKHHATTLPQVNDEIIEAWMTTWMRAQTGKKKLDKLAYNTRRKRIGYLRAFFRYATAKKMISANPMGTIETPQEDAQASQRYTRPLDLDGTTRTYDLIMKNAPDAVGRLNKRGGGRHPFTLRLRAANSIMVLRLMYATGMRISDAINFNLKGLRVDKRGGMYEFIPIKTRRKGTRVTAFLTRQMADELRALECLSPDMPFFRPEDGDNFEHTQCIRRILWNIEDDLSMPKGSFKCHMFRNSFAVNALNRGVGIEYVSKMLGHRNILVTQKYYSPWVQSRIDTMREVWLKCMDETLPVAA